MGKKGGARPGAGRPRLTLNEKVTRELVMKRAWNLVHSYIDKADEPIKQRAGIAIQLAVKSVPQEIKGGLTVTTLEKAYDNLKRLSTGTSARVAERPNS